MRGLPLGGGLVVIMALASPLRAEVLLTPEQEQKVRSGEIVVKVVSPDRPVVVVGLVDAPPEQTFRIYSDFANYGRIFGLPESQVTHQEGNTVLGRFAVDFPWPFGRRWTLNEAVVEPARRIFTFKRRDGTFKIYEGSLRVLAESPTRSRVIYAARIDPNLPVPPWIVQWAQERVFPDVIRSVRSFVAKQDESL
ncbi:Polyketide cyclase / dehydrase and lipid transport [compost metagenome]